MLSKNCVFRTGALAVIAIAIIILLCLLLPGSNNKPEGEGNPGNGGNASTESSQSTEDIRSTAGTTEVVQTTETNESTEGIQSTEDIRSTAGTESTESSESNENGGENNAEAFSRILVVESSSCTLTAFDVNNLANSSIIHEGFNSSHPCNFELYLKDSIFFSNDTESIVSTSDKYPKMKIPANGFTILFNRLLYTIEVDFANKKLYAISKHYTEAYKLFVLDLVEQHYSIILADLDVPTDLALDPAVGLLFISQDLSILRVSMDGLSPTEIVKKPRLDPVLFVDRTAQRVYYSTYYQVESVDYHGNNKRFFVYISDPPIQLKAVGGYLFWSTRSGLWTCQYDDKTRSCGPTKELKLKDDSEIGEIKAYDFEEMYSIMKSRSNPCANNNGGCEQLCLLSNITSEGYSCACELGQRLKEDQKSCVGATDQGFLMYVQGKSIRGRMLDRLGTEDNDEPRFGEVIYPVFTPSFTLEKVKMRHFAHDIREQLFYYSDDIAVSKVSLVEFRKMSVRIEDFECEVHLATDWVTKTFYVSMSSYNDTKSMNRGKNGLRVYLYGYFWDPIVEDKNYHYKSLVDYDDQYRPRSVVAHPNRGYVFYILKEVKSNTSRLVRINSDGSDEQYFLENRRVREIGLSIDFLEDRLCWFSEDGTKLESVNIDGSIDSLRSIDISMVTDPYSLTFDENFAYVSNWTQIWRLNKATGAAAVRLRHVNTENHLYNRDLLAGVSYHSIAAQPILENHPCFVDKGGCETLCFAVPDSKEPTGLKKQCGCLEDETLQPDGRSCVKNTVN